MSTTNPLAADSSAFDRGTDSILRVLSRDQARQIAEFRGDDALRARIDELAEKCRAGELTAAERAEYEGFVQANNFVAVLQARARRLLRSAAADG